MPSSRPMPISAAMQPITNATIRPGLIASTSSFGSVPSIEPVTDRSQSRTTRTFGPGSRSGLLVSVPMKLMSLRYAGSVQDVFGASRGPGTRRGTTRRRSRSSACVAFPKGAQRRAKRLGCRPMSVVSADPADEAPPAIDHGTAGFGARKEYDRRVAKREQAIEAKWGTGRMGRFVKFVSDHPQSTSAWAKGARGEELLGRRLNDELDGKAAVLHDRKMPGTSANIDHIVIGPERSVGDRRQALRRRDRTTGRRRMAVVPTSGSTSTIATRPS